MRKRRRPRRPRASTPSQKRQAYYQGADPRWLQGQGRTGRLPRTLIDASTVANAAVGLRNFAAAIDTDRPCWAQTVRRFAEQVENSYSEAAAIAAMTDVPTASAAFSETAFSETAATEGAFSEQEVEEPEV